MQSHPNDQMDQCIFILREYDELYEYLLTHNIEFSSLVVLFRNDDLGLVYIRIQMCDIKISFRASHISPVGVDVNLSMYDDFSFLL